MPFYSHFDFRYRSEKLSSWKEITCRKIGLPFLQPPNVVSLYCVLKENNLVKGCLNNGYFTFSFKRAEPGAFSDSSNSS